MTGIRTEIDQGGRFKFGANWLRFLSTVDEGRIAAAENSLCEMMQSGSLDGKSFLDIGSGTGLFSLAARRLGASVVSFDCDPQCVACTHELKNRYRADDDAWRIENGSVLDGVYMESLQQFDIVYSWGVLHHTGDMGKAIDLAAQRVRNEGVFFVSIYNDQGGASRRWLKVKQLYNKLPSLLKPVLVTVIASWYETKYAFVRFLQRRNPLPFNDWKRVKEERGMSAWHDWVDWCGGLPFEVAKPEQVIVPLRRKGFILDNLKTQGGGWGCNQYVFHRRPSSRSPDGAADAD